MRSGDGSIELGNKPQEELAVESLAQGCSFVASLFLGLEHRRGGAVHLSPRKIPSPRMHIAGLASQAQAQAPITNGANRRSPRQRFQSIRERHG